MKNLNQIHQETTFDSGGSRITKPVKLVLKKDAIRFCVTAAQRVTFPILQKVMEELNKWENNLIIEEVTAPTDWCTPIVPVKQTYKQKKRKLKSSSEKRAYF